MKFKNSYMKYKRNFNMHFQRKCMFVKPKSILYNGLCFSFMKTKNTPQHYTVYFKTVLTTTYVIAIGSDKLKLPQNTINFLKKKEIN